MYNKINKKTPTYGSSAQVTQPSFLKEETEMKQP